MSQQVEIDAASAAQSSKATTRKPVPPLGEPRLAPELRYAERTLANGLRVIAVRRDSVPLVEVRLRAPFNGAVEEVAPAQLLAETMLSGTERFSNIEIAAELQRIGGNLSTAVDADRFVISGNTLASALPRLLELVTDVVTGATYPDAEVATEREHLVDQIQIALSQAGTAARIALLRRIYGAHPYAIALPKPAAVASVQPAELRSLHRDKLRPAGSVLVIVGAGEARALLDTAEATLGQWSVPGKVGAVAPTPALEPGPWLLVNRPGSVQSSLRVALPAVGRAHADYPALQLANLIFGGYFSSRVVENIREDKGYTYSPHSVIEHSVAGSVVVFDADVATEVTAPALNEVTYELGRMATTAPTGDELDNVRQYAIGTLTLATATQSGLASWLATLAGTGLRLDWLASHSERLAKVTLEEVQIAAARYLSPARSVTLVLGDVEAVEQSLAPLHGVEHGSA